MKYPVYLSRIAAITIVLCALSSNLLGQTTYYWETTGLNDGTLVGGTGAWNPTNTFFTTSSTDAGTAIAWPTSDTRNTVIFGGTTPGTVTLSALTAYIPTGGTSTTTNHLVNNLTFTTSGYTLTGNAIRFIYNGTTNGSINVGSGITATINTGISGGTTSGLVNGTTNGNISNNVLIQGGGTLNLGGGNASLGFTVDGGTTVRATGGISSFSGSNLNVINNSSVIRAVTTNNVFAGPSSFSNTAGSGTLDLASTLQTVSTIGGNLLIDNSNANGVLNLALVGNALTHTGNISNGTGKLSLATTGTFSQGSGFSSSVGFATQTLAGSNTFTGSTSLGRGTLALDFSNAIAPASNILYSGGFGTPTGDDGKLIIARPTATIPHSGLNTANSAIGSLATLTLTGKANTTNTQQFNGLKLTGGAANVIINPNATANTVTLNLGSTIERSSGSLINFATTNATTVLSTSASIQSTAGTASGVLKDANGVAFAVMGGRDWAAKNAAGTNIVTGSTAGAGGTSIYTNSTPTGFAANADIAIPVAGGAANDVRLGANTTISTLKYADSSRSGVNLGGNTLTTGGILTSQTNTSSGNFISNGSITSPGASGSDIVLYSNTSNFFGVNAALVDGAASTGFTKGGNGFVIQNANNTYTGALTVTEGGLVIRGTNTASGINVVGSQTNLTGVQLQSAGNSTAGSYVQLGNADATGSLGSGTVNLGVGAVLGIKRSDSFTLNNNTQGLGGLTQGWSGTTTLASTAVLADSKYNHVGDTTISAGTLRLDYTAGNNGIISNSSRLVFSGGTVDIANNASHVEVVRDFILTAGGSSITKTGGSAAGVLQLGTFSDATQAGSTLNIAAAGIAQSISANTAGILGSRARVTVGSAGSYDWATTLATGTVATTPINALSTYTALATTAGTDTNNSLQALTGTTTLTGSRTTNTLKLTNGSGANQTVDIGTGNTLALTAGGLLVTGTDGVTVSNGTLRSASPTTSDLIIHQYNSGGLTINSAITNGLLSSTLTKSGDGVLTLTADNTFSGSVFINGGKLSVGANSQLGAIAAGNINVQTSSTGSTTVTLASPTLPAGFQVGSALLGQTVSAISGTTVTLTANANATITTSTASAYTTGSTLVMNNGTLLANSSFSLGTTLAGVRDRAITFNGIGGTIEVTPGNTLTAPGTTSGPGGLTKTGSGTLVLSNTSNTYSGPTNVAEGTLRFGTGANPTRSNFTVQTGATLDQSNGGNTIGSLSGDGTVTNTGAAATLSIGSTHTDSTFSGLLTNATNALNIDKMGAGTLTITGATNNYTGSTTISGGTLALSGVGALPDTTAVNVSSASGTFDISGISGSSETIRTLAGVNASSVVLGSKNLAVGDDFGTVSVTASTTTGTSVTVASVPSYLTVGSLMLGRRVDAISGTTITLNGTANIGVTTNPVAVNVYADTGDTTYAGVISGVGGSISKDGDANLTLTGANTYTGLTTVDRGVLTVTNSSGLGTADAGTVVNYNGNTSGGRLDLNGVTLTEAITIQGGRFGNNFGVGLQAVGGTTSNITNTVTITGVAIPNYVTTTNSEFRIGGSGTNTVLNLNAGVTRSGLAAANAGTLLFVPGAGSTINVNGAIDNNGGSLGFGGSGTTVLNAVSTEVGSVGLDFTGVPGNFGTLRLGINNALPSGSNLRIGSATGSTGIDPNGPLGRLDMAGFNLTVARLDGSRGLVVTGTPNNSSNRVVTNSTAGSSTLTIGTSGGAVAQQVFEGVIENGNGGGTVAITKILGSTQTFSGDVANTYTGLTTVNGGSLILAKDAGLNAIAGNVVIGDGATTAGLDIVQLTNSNQIADTSVISFNGTGTNAGTLRLNNQSETIGGLSSTGGAGIVENNNAAAGTSLLTSNVATGSTVFSGILRNNGGVGAGVLAFTKDGAGTQVFTGVSSYTGATIVNAGTLLANNATGSALGASDVTVEAAGIFGGTGSITGLVALNGGVLSPGASIDTLAVGGVSGTGSLLIEYDGAAGQQIDVLDVAGDIDATGITLNFASLGAALADPFYVFAKYSGTLTGTFAAINSQPAGYLIDYDYLGNKEIALVTAVPEPGTIALLVMAGIGGGLYRRSRNLKKDVAKA